MFGGGSLNLSLEAIQAFKEHLLNLILIRIVKDNSPSFRSRCLKMSEEQLVQSIIPIADLESSGPIRGA
jgi:hypothetical protein